MMVPARGRNVKHKTDKTSGGKRPTALPVLADSVPTWLQQLPQWVVWRYEQRLKKNGDVYWTKVPYNAWTGELASSTDPPTWSSWEQALARYKAGGVDGVGIVFALDGDLVGFDLDDCRDPDSGDIGPWGRILICTLDGYTEISPSGTGVKVWTRGRKPEWLKRRCRQPHHDGEIEVYDRGRYFCVTGHRVDGTPETPGAPENIETACRIVFTAVKTKSANTNGRAGPGGLTDEQVLDLAPRAKNGALFSSLWKGSTAGHGGDASRADAALCSLLRWWCGGDMVQVDRLFRQSGLMRDKWDEKRGATTYGAMTLAAVDDGDVREPDIFDGVRIKAGEGNKPDKPDLPERSEPWGDPLPLGELRPSEPFPVDTLPGDLQRLVAEMTESLNAQPDYVAVPMLVMAGAAAGRSRVLAKTSSHEEPAILWAAIVSPTGTRKTPALGLVSKPLEDREGQLREEHELQVARHEIDVETWKAVKKEGRGEKPRRPRCARLMVEDSTTERLACLLNNAPRGLALVADDFTGWVLRLNQYRGGAGADRQFYLSCWSSRPATIDRVKDGDSNGLFVKRPFLSIVGGIQPSRLKDLRGDQRGRRAADDGWMDRLLFASPDIRPARRETYQEVSYEARTGWARILDRLWGLHMAQTDSGPAPFFLKFDGEARECWADFTQELADEVNSASFPDHLRGPWAKFEAYGLRLSLVCRLLRWAGGPDDDDGDNCKAPVMAKDVEAACKLVRYFMGGARRVYGAMGADPELAKARSVLAWLAARDWKGASRFHFKRHEAFSCLHSDGGDFTRAEDLDAPLGLLIDHGYLRFEPPPEQRFGKPGRRPDGVYEVNPVLFRDRSG